MPHYHKFIFIVLLLTNLSYPVKAAEGKAGLPQLDFNTYPSLIFWSIVSLILGYLLMRYLVTPNIKSILNNRETNIQNDLVRLKLQVKRQKKLKKILLILKQS